MNITAKGIRPARRTDWMGLMNQGCLGIWRGMDVVLVGCSQGADLMNPYQEPTYTRGSWIHSQRRIIPSTVEKGRAVDDACAQTNRFRTNIKPKRRPGNKRAVINVFRRQFSPPNVL